LTSIPGEPFEEIALFKIASSDAESDEPSPTRTPLAALKAMILPAPAAVPPTVLPEAPESTATPSSPLAIEAFLAMVAATRAMALQLERRRLPRT
jgi:hypothetical protein